MEIRVPPLELKESSELECWTDFITRFEVALINTSLAITPAIGNTISTDDSAGTSGTESQGKPKVDDSDYRRGGLLLNCIGNDGYKIFTKWKLLVKDISYRDLTARYTAEFTKKQNIFVTRYKFFNIEQLGGESVESFIDRITKAAAYCALGDLEEAMILQCLTKGIKNETLRKEILYIEDCNLDKARRVCFSFESAQKSNNIMGDKPDQASVGAVGFYNKRDSSKRDSTSAGPSTQRPCGICKSSEHWAHKCPEKKKLKCTVCSKKGHTANFCRNKVQAVEVQNHKNTDGAESEESL